MQSLILFKNKYSLVISKALAIVNAMNLTG